MLTWTAIAAAVCVLAVVVWIERARVHSGLLDLAHLRWGWVPLALVAESGSMASLARSQLELLKVGGIRLNVRHAIAVTYAGNAMSVSLPLVGAGVGAAFSFKQWRKHGVDSAAISWALTVSGVMSALSFALLTTVGAAVSGNHTALILGLTGAAVSALPALAVLLGVRIRRVRLAMIVAADAAARKSRRVAGHPKRDIAAGLETLLDRAGSLNATHRQYTIAFCLALRNWIADCLCLVAAIKAAGAPIPWHGLLLAYCVAVTAGSAGLTPGGIGVVEIALTASLVAAGLPANHAVLAVIVYRLISFWLVVAIGWLVAARLSRGDGAKREEVIAEALVGVAENASAPAQVPGPEER